ncbi:putative proline-rich receptor-like protein kinase PERK11 [Acorus calamus]|uniref:Proline-rich receptor-like protein kinase PERK11 n=1 Tax=Acorus calamus TaxID=4465 RepID=A0AAV9F565_ACOCL|nr:putative proline-rich receptor-like protein kinase PERK11 [Acorus calamus]
MTAEGGLGDGNKSQGRCIFVGIRIDSNGRDLINWALTKVAQPDDRVVAIHVCRDSDLRITSTLSLIKSVDVCLQEYEALCKTKKVSLVGRVSRGNSIRKILVREAERCAATTVIVGICKDSAFGGSLSLARFCAEKLPSTTTVTAVQDGKVIFERVATAPTSGVKADAKLKRGYPRRLKKDGTDTRVPMPSSKVKPVVVAPKSSFIGKSVSNLGRKSRNGLDVKMDTLKQNSPKDSKSSKSETTQNESPKEIPIVCKQPEEAAPARVFPTLKEFPSDKPGWPLLRRSISDIPKTSGDKDARKMSVVQWVMNLPSRSSPSTPQSWTDLNNSQKLFEQEPFPSIEVHNDLETLLKSNASSIRRFSHKELQSSTNQFSQDNMIGKGGSSCVYKGSLSDSKPVAIKVFKSSKEARKDFLLEFNIITTLKHDNILPLTGVCIEDDDLISVYGFLSRGSLEENLHGTSTKPPLPWDVRFTVAIGVADALNYLHSGSSRPVIHRDVKSSNILLSDEFEPKLSDFGLAIWAPTASYATHNDVVGTFGYLAPEYFMYGKVSDKIDVYSFGVVLLELLTGRKPIDSENPKGQESLVMWATPMLEKGDIAGILDPNLNGKFDEAQMQRMVLAASLCITRAARLRPHMSQVLNLLKGEEDLKALAESQAFSPKELENHDEEAYPASDMQSHIGLAFLDVSDDTSFSSMEQGYHNSIEEYLRGRWSRSSSFD